MWVKKGQVSNSGRMVGLSRFDQSAAPSATTAFAPSGSLLNRALCPFGSKRLLARTAFGSKRLKGTAQTTILSGNQK